MHEVKLKTRLEEIVPSVKWINVTEVGLDYEETDDDSDLDETGDDL